MSQFFRFLGALVDGINRVAVIIAEIALAALLVFVVYAVVARYVFNSPSAYAIEICVYLMLVSVWGAVGWVHKLDRHVAVDALRSRLGRVGQRVTRTIAHLSILSFCLLLVWAGTSVAETAYLRDYRSASLLRFPLWIAYGLIPAGALLLSLMAFKRLVSGRDSSGDMTKEI